MRKSKNEEHLGKLVSEVKNLMILLIVTFGKDCVIQENNSVIQQKIIAFVRMVANAMMFYTVANTTNVLNQLSAEEVKYSKDDLLILSAYFRENINRYGVFELSRSRQTMPLEFGIYRD